MTNDGAYVILAWELAAIGISVKANDHLTHRSSEQGVGGMLFWLQFVEAGI